MTTTNGPRRGWSTGELDGRHALVTGGASGIGRATARRFAREGVDVVIGDIDATGGRALAEEIGATFVELDVGDLAAWDRVVADHGPFDMGFLNAGIATGGQIDMGSEAPLARLDDAAYRRIMSVNVDGVVFGARALLPGMRQAGGGDIVVTASMAGLGPIAVDPIYGLTKHAVVGLVRSVAAALDADPGSGDVCIAAICPGFTDTAILADEAKSRIASFGLEVMAPEHIADVVVRALRERINGAQWVIWPDVPVAPYEWASPLPLPSSMAAPSASSASSASSTSAAERTG
jgi:NAD(P)-dependent dehydrogenase (short-subunit alcohol dehydrogenase family)